MTTVDAVSEVSISRPAGRVAERPLGGVRFDLWMILPLVWLVSGAYLDAWAHNHLGDKLETFFTPWHAVLYSGFLAVALSIGIPYIRNIVRGHDWRKAVPAGYDLSLAAVVLFGLGGVGDMIWHTLFGIELNADAALSPTHILLQVGLVLLASGPLRAAWQRADKEEKPGWRASLPMVLSMALTLATLTMIAQVIHPLVMLWSTTAYELADPRATMSGLLVGVTGMMITTAFAMGLVLLAVRRWGKRIPFGALTLVFTLDAIYLSLMRDQYRLIPAMVAGGLAADLILWRLKETDLRQVTMRMYGFAVPVILFTVYFLILLATDHIWWTIHAVAGSTFLAGVAGLLVSLLVFPPPIPAREA